MEVTAKAKEITESLAKATGVSYEEVSKVLEQLGIEKTLVKLDEKELATIGLDNAKFGVRMSSGNSDV